MGVMHSTTDNRNVYDALVADMQALEGSHVKVGFPEGAKPGKQRTAGSGHKPYADVSEVARVATWMEFGVPDKNIPERPFFRNFLDHVRVRLGDFQEKIVHQVILGRMSPARAFEALGLWGQNELRKSIQNGDYVKNSPRTIAEKGSDHPLIDSAQMINSVTYVTIKGGAGGKKRSESLRSGAEWGAGGLASVGGA